MSPEEEYNVEKGNCWMITVHNNIYILIMMAVWCFEGRVRVGRWIPPQVAHLKVSTLLPMHFTSNCQRPFQTSALLFNFTKVKRGIVSGWRRLGKHLFSLLVASRASFPALIHIGAAYLQILHFRIWSRNIFNEIWPFAGAFQWVGVTIRPATDPKIPLSWICQPAIFRLLCQLVCFSFAWYCSHYQLRITFFPESVHNFLITILVR